VRVFDTEDQPGSVAEGAPVERQSSVKAWVSIMYGCNNFCTYCIVPYVRGRERSRRPEAILDEVRQLAQAGYKDITLLGQNVNSYGKDLEEDVDFAWLLEQVNAIPGDFLIRFMTSHPKDATERLFDAMAKCEKVAPVIHLPFQAGNDRVLREMNRGYTHEEYLSKVRALRERIPDIVLTSDVIVGFPGETTEEFEDTLKLIQEVRYDALFTFIYSPRQGTPAAEMDDPLSPEEKKANFQRLLDAQNEISREKHRAYVGKTVRCLVDGQSDDPRNNLNARTSGNRLVHLTGDPALVGQYVDLKITDATTWALFGELA
jgi:tRNA-2-methylthio-N6-dimethylallyladenosine synthase